VRTPSDAASRPASRCLRPLLVLAAFAVASCTPSGVLTPTPKVDVGMHTAAVAYVPPSTQMQPVQPAQPAAITYAAAGFPRFEPPVAHSLPQSQMMPADEIDCRRQLRKLGVAFRDLPTIDEGGACHVDWPVEVSGLPNGIRMKPAATLSCQMALSFAAWTKDELVPSVRWRYFTGVKTIRQGSSYSCRKIAGTSTPSEHSKGNALDVMSIELNSGRDIDVRKPGFFAFRQKKLLANVRKGGCEYFTTVLGPGYNADHADHFHFDIKSRRNGYVACR